MQRRKLLVVILGAVGVAGFLLTAWELRSIQQNKLLLATAEYRQSDLQRRIANLEAQMQAAETRTRAIQSDNALLSEAIERASRTNAVKSQPAPISQAVFDERFKRALPLATNGDPEEALRELLWCYDEDVPGLNNSEKSFMRANVITALGQLSDRYPGAQVVLRERLESARQRVRASTDDSEPIAEFANLARALKDESTLLSVYDQIPPQDTRRKTLAIYGFDAFVSSQRYNDALVGKAYASMSSNFEVLSNRKATPDAASWAASAQRRRVIETAATNVEALAGAGDTEHATALANRLLKFDNMPETRELVQKHLERAGRPDLLEQLSKP